ncbi:hypothetical protein HPB51_003390 [Rhipicephalus microplus]|uniref:Uncharacterized protein n=1 Tax=Rhipicephalus microplus TaxID=6941 RepID=A0A9J6D4G7_RHIMP|nr:hypothetical protein HPB51_003390 [Rhipicephalus microplus]
MNKMNTITVMYGSPFQHPYFFAEVLKQLAQEHILSNKELERVLATMSNASVYACDDFYSHVCGGIERGGDFRELQQYSLYELLGKALGSADPDGFPGDVRPLIYFYKRCLVVMTGPVVDAAEVHSLLAHYNLSVEVFESAARDVIIEHLVWLAAHGDLVPALRIRRNVATPDSQSRRERINTRNAVHSVCSAHSAGRDQLIGTGLQISHWGSSIFEFLSWFWT